MADTTGERSEQAERGRALTTKPFEEGDAAAERDSAAPRADLASAVKRAAATAIIAAAGALGAATKALLQRRAARRDRNAEDEDTDREPRAGEVDDPRSEQEHEPAASAGEEDSTAPAGNPDPVAGAAATDDARDDDESDRTDDLEPHAALGDREATDQPAETERPEAREDEGPAQDHRPDSSSQPPTADATAERDEDRSADSDDDRTDPDRPAAARAVDRARSELQQLIGSEPESVSGIERSDGAWTITFEVVEDHRVPDSMDVLSSYEVVFEDEGGVQRIARTHRYRRSQVEQM